MYMIVIVYEGKSEKFINKDVWYIYSLSEALANTIYYNYTKQVGAPLFIEHSQSCNCPIKKGYVREKRDRNGVIAHLLTPAESCNNTVIKGDNRELSIFTGRGAIYSWGGPKFFWVV